MNTELMERRFNPEIIAGQIRIRHSGQVAMIVESEAGGKFNAVDLMMGKLVFENWIEKEDCEIIRRRYREVLKEPRQLRWT